jgi:MHS family proline/betaine transporter-like MFS transporter
MTISSLLIAIISIPLFSLLKDASISVATIVLVIFVLIGVSFSAPMHHLALEMAPYKHRAKIIAISYAVGSQMIGIPSCFIGLWLYKKTNIVWAPAIYLSAIALISFIFVYKYSLSKKVTEKPLSTSI